MVSKKMQELCDSIPMNDQMRPRRFFNNGHNAPAYSCDMPENQSGYYLKAEHVIGLLGGIKRYAENGDLDAVKIMVNAEINIFNNRMKGGDQ